MVKTHEWCFHTEQNGHGKVWYLWNWFYVWCGLMGEVLFTRNHSQAKCLEIKSEKSTCVSICRLVVRWSCFCKMSGATEVLKGNAMSLQLHGEGTLCVLRQNKALLQWSQWIKPGPPGHWDKAWKGCVRKMRLWIFSGVVFFLLIYVFNYSQFPLKTLCFHFNRADSISCLSLQYFYVYREVRWCKNGGQINKLHTKTHSYLTHLT